ncbi:MAG: cytochrome c3 family protein [Longimicrobiales bacterium]
MKKKLTVILGGVVFVIATLALLLVQSGGEGSPESGLTGVAVAQEAPVQDASTRADQDAAAGSEVRQPIEFPHDVHVSEYQIDCQYCHYSAERSVDAGMPPVGTCMGCHTVVPGSENPEEVETLREYANDGEAIPWVRVYKVADHVHFPHLRHVSAGVECQTCHGEVQEMGVVEEVAQPLTMGWCVTCHEERNASRDCTVCHY